MTSGIGNLGAANAAAPTHNRHISKLQERQQAFRDLSIALQAGNLDAAKKAYSTLSKDISASLKANNPIAQLGQALRNNDLAGAQKLGQAFLPRSLEQRIRSAGNSNNNGNTGIVPPHLKPPQNTANPGNTGIVPPNRGQAGIVPAAPLKSAPETAGNSGIVPPHRLLEDPISLAPTGNNTGTGARIDTTA